MTRSLKKYWKPAVMVLASLLFAAVAVLVPELSAQDTGGFLLLSASFMPVAPGPIVPGYSALRSRANPRSAGVPETIPHWLYATQTYTDNSTTQLTFFTDNQANRSLSNLQSGGSLPDPQYLTIFGIYCDIINATADTYVTTAAGGTSGAINDIGSLVMVALPRFVLRIQSKDYGPWPLSVCHATGGATGFGWGTFTAEESLQYANNGVMGKGAEINGFITIPPRGDFSVTVDWNAAANITGDYRVRMTLFGLLSRAVK